jgi:hypothetical protein
MYSFKSQVHSCFVDDGAGGERKQLLDDKGYDRHHQVHMYIHSENFRCAIDQVILPDLSYNQQTSMAYAEVHVFKFADKVTTSPFNRVSFVFLKKI